MKNILWFSNIIISDDALTQILHHKSSGGWLLQEASKIYREVNLSIAFVDPYGESRNKGGNITTYSLKPSNFKLKRLSKVLFGEKFDNDSGLVKQMQRVIEDSSPDIIHIHGTEGIFVEIIPYARSKNIPVLVSIQGIMSVISKKYIDGYSEKLLKNFWNYDGLKSIVPKRSWYRKYKLNQLRAERELEWLPQIDFFTGRTDWDFNIINLVNPSAKYFKVDRIINQVFVDNEWIGRGHNGQICIHTTMGDSPIKGLEVIAEAFYLLKYYGHKVYWRIAGIEEQSASVKLAKKKLGNKYPKNGLEFLGRLNHIEMVEYMLRADFYVMASHIENSPNNLAEAMVLGMPCIASLAGGTATYLENNKTGLLFQSGDPFALAGAIVYLHNNPLVANKLGGNARKEAIQRHNLSRVKEQILTVYDSIIQ